MVAESTETVTPEVLVSLMTLTAGAELGLSCPNAAFVGETASMFEALLG
jgi:hypothetical protein